VRKNRILVTSKKTTQAEQLTEADFSMTGERPWFEKWGAMIGDWLVETHDGWDIVKAEDFENEFQIVKEE
jgi:hypothetical protein